MTAQNSHIITIDDAQAAVAPTKTSRFQILFERENLTVEIYRPVSTDHQKPHNRDECYVIIEGAGGVEMDGKIVDFVAGDLIFVAAGVPHRFVNFGQSLLCWVIFYGPEGGEAGTGPGASSSS